MIITATITKDALQFNMLPETEPEREMLRVLAKHEGTAHISRGSNFTMTQGGFLRDFGQPADSIAVTIRAADDPGAIGRGCGEANV